MDQNLLIIIAVFVFVAAVALCIQAALLFAVFKSTREIERKTLPLLPKLDALAESSRLAIDDSRQQIHDITTKANEILDITKIQLVRVDEVMEDAAGRVRIQMDRAEMVLDDAMSRAQETVAVVHSGIMIPLREIQGVTAGVRAAIHFLLRGRNSHVQATADEEMFI
jgi:flagellar biosynthesis protein FliQ